MSRSSVHAVPGSALQGGDASSIGSGGTGSAARGVAWLMERAPDAAVLTDRRGVIQYVNPAFERMTGYTRDEVLGRTPAILKSGAQNDAFYERLWRTLQEGDEFHDVLVNRRKDGSLFCEAQSIRPLFDADGRIVHYLSAGHEVAQGAAAAPAPEARDRITGLITRDWFMERVAQALAAPPPAGGGGVALMLVAVDDLRRIDERHGEAAGDALLCRTAERLLGQVRAGDSVARLAGGEFGLLLRGLADEAAAAAMARSVARAVLGPLEFGGRRLAAPLRAGLALPAPGEVEAARLLEQARRALAPAARLAEPSSPARGADGATPLPAADITRCARAGSPTAELLLAADPQAGLRRRVVHAGEAIYRAGQPFHHVYLLNAGSVKLVSATPEGGEHVVGFRLNGDWLGFDGVAGGRHTCEAIATDIGEVWCLEYGPLLESAGESPALLALILRTLSEDLDRDREARLNLTTLSAHGRVARFLRQWVDQLARAGLRHDQFTLHLSRAEIGSYLGLRIESVSRAMRRLETDAVIRLSGADRRELAVTDLAALQALACAAG